MNNLISPIYQMQIIADIESVLWNLFSTSKYKKVRFYIEKWHIKEYDWNTKWENFTIKEKKNGEIDLLETLNNIDGETLLKIAIDLGIETPDFIPSIPMFKNELKTSYETAYATFDRALKQVEEHPNIAIGLANSALESVIKEILKDERLNSKISSKKTLYDLVSELLSILQLFPKSEMPKEIKTIGSSLLAINKSIESLRSDKTEFHGKTSEDYLIKDPLYAYFIVNSIVTVALFLNSYYRKKFTVNGG